MTKEQLAATLNGREYREEMEENDILAAKVNGLVVVYGASDDLIEFVGAIRGEQGAWEGGTFYVDKNGLIDNDHGGECEECPYKKEACNKARKIKAIWAEDGYSWIYKTDIPHATFDILEDGEKYCRGIVFSMKDLEAHNA